MQGCQKLVGKWADKDDLSCSPYPGGPMLPLVPEMGNGQDPGFSPGMGQVSWQALSRMRAVWTCSSGCLYSLRGYLILACVYRMFSQSSPQRIKSCTLLFQLVTGYFLHHAGKIS